MHKDKLPLKIDPFRFAENAISLHGSLYLNEMPRLASSVGAAVEGEVTVDVDFGVDEQRVAYVKGHFTTLLPLQCQRCMESFEHEITGDFISGILRTQKEAEELPEHYDFLVVEDGNLNISDVIEDELIICLPLVPMHEPSHCKVTLPFVSDADLTVPTEKENPFKAIESLRSKRNLK